MRKITGGNFVKNQGWFLDSLTVGSYKKLVISACADLSACKHFTVNLHKSLVRTLHFTFALHRQLRQNAVSGSGFLLS